MPVRTKPGSERAPIRTLEDAERAHILLALRETNWVVGGPSGAAAQLGLPRTTLIARMQRLGISNQASGQRAGHSNQQLITLPGKLSDVPHFTQEETRAYDRSSGLRDDAAADFRRMRAAAG